MVIHSVNVHTPRHARRRRSQWARVTLLVAILTLTWGLVRMQVFAGEQYALVAKENRLRPLVERAPRGTIYDRHGQVVAENTVGYEVALMPAPEDSIRAQLARLSGLLELSPDNITGTMRRYRRTPNLPIIVLRDAEPWRIARLEERRGEFSGVLINEYPKRRYPAGDVVAHIVGYVAEISEAELLLPNFAAYRQGRWIGKAGLERQYEAVLGGEPGVRYIEVDASGRIKRWLPRETGIPPIPGRDLHLHLDLDLQRYIAEIWPEGYMGGFVALDPRTGGVLAYYSTPGYDPNRFVGGIDLSYWGALNEDENVPLMDRAGGSNQPPGSTFKLLHAAMALDLGVIRPEEFMPIPCTGGMSYGGRYARCHAVHGRQNLILGIKNSCDVYFYQVGIRVGLRRFLEQGTRLGFGRATGIDLPTEVRPIFPTGLKWMEDWYGYVPPENEIMSLSIGQGAITWSPLKLAHTVVALARPDAQAPAPRLAQLDTTAPITFELPSTPDQIAVIQQGMRRVVGPGGTAWLTRLQNWDLLGKTGTSQNPHGEDHGWFVGIAGPAGEEPEIVAAMVVLHGEAGSRISGTPANAMNFYLNRKHGLPFDRYGTPRERIPRGLLVDWAWLSSPVVDYPVGGGEGVPAEN
ncbi:MAG TPA: penicillin-binding transpeptidase domain-containing protein [Longimicrobiales bacterium]|nr:penicillin-binding transpeptidase domain-containing protein [Longimicrobiales bacterium]